MGPLDGAGFPGGAVVKNLPANAGDTKGASPGLGRPPGEGNGNPLQYSCLENSMDREARVTESQTRLSTDTDTGDGAKRGRHPTAAESRVGLSKAGKASAK